MGEEFLRVTDEERALTAEAVERNGSVEEMLNESGRIIHVIELAIQRNEQAGNTQ